MKTNLSSLSVSRKHDRLIMTREIRNAFLCEGELAFVPDVHSEVVFIEWEHSNGTEAYIMLDKAEANMGFLVTWKCPLEMREFFVKKHGGNNRTKFVFEFDEFQEVIDHITDMVSSIEKETKNEQNPD